MEEDKKEELSNIEEELEEEEEANDIQVRFSLIK